MTNLDELDKLHSAAVKVGHDYGKCPFFSAYSALAAELRELRASKAAIRDEAFMEAEAKLTEWADVLEGAPRAALCQSAIIVGKMAEAEEEKK